MLSSSVLQLLKSVFTSLDSFRILPFSWNDSSQSVQVRNSFRRLFLNHIFGLHTLLYSAFVSWSISHHWAAPIMEKYWAGICIVGYPGVFEASLQCILKRNEIASLFWQINALDEVFDGVRLSPTQKRNRAREEKVANWIIKINIFGVFAFSIVVVLVFLIKPNSFFFLYSYLYSGRVERGTIAFLLILVFETLSKFVGCAVFLFVPSMFIFAVVFEVMMLSLLRKSVDPLNKKLRLHRCLYLYNHIHTSAYLSTTMLSRMATLGYYLVLSFFVLIDYSGNLKKHELFFLIYLSSWALGMGSLFILASGKVLKDSAGFLGKQRRLETLSAYERKCLRAMRSFGLRIGPSKPLRYSALSTFYFFIIKGLTTLLVRRDVAS